MDYLKFKAQHWDFLEGREWKINRCASKSQRNLIKKMYRKIKRSARARAKKDINRALANES